MIDVSTLNKKLDNDDDEPDDDEDDDDDDKKKMHGKKNRRKSFMREANEAGNPILEVPICSTSRVNSILTFLFLTIFEAPICSRSLIISCLLSGFLTYRLSAASCILVNISTPGMPVCLCAYIRT